MTASILCMIAEQYCASAYGAAGRHTPMHNIGAVMADALSKDTPGLLLDDRRVVDETVHCASSATYQICFRLPIPNPNPNPKP